MSAHLFDTDDLAFYAMGSLEPAEMASVRAHLASCGDCRATLAEIYEDFSVLAMAAPSVPAPAAVRQRLLAGIENEIDLASSQSIQAFNSSPKSATGGRSFLPAWFPWAAAAASIAVAVAVGVNDLALRTTVNSQSSQLRDLSLRAQRATEVLEVLTAPEAQRVTLTAGKTSPPQPVGRAIYLKSRGQLIFTASNLNPLPANKVYELWVIPANGAAPIPAGTFSPDTGGSATVILPQIPIGVDAKAFGVTVENPGGADKPTAPIVLVGA